MVLNRKALSILVVATFLMSMSVFVVPVMAEPVNPDLIIDGGDNPTDIGEVQVSNDGQYLYVKFVIDSVDPPWSLVEIHVAVAATLDEIPQKKGNPIPGKFLYKAEDLSGTEYELDPIPLEWDPDTTLYIAAHAEVGYDTGLEDPITGEPIWVYETAWADGSDFPGSNWATYFTYTVQEI